MAKQEVIKMSTALSLSEKIKDITKIPLQRGQVLLEIIEKKIGDLFLPEGFDRSKSEYVYFKVLKTGNEEFAKTHPEFIYDGITSTGNYVLYLKPNAAPILSNKGKEYLIVHESILDIQVTPDNYTV